MKRPVIFISGVSSGIGNYLAKILSAKFQIIGSIRKESDELRIAQQIPGIILVNLDYSSIDGLEKSLNKFLEKYPELKIYTIINNAGIAHPGPLIELPIHKLEDQFRVNVFSQILVIQKLFSRLYINQSRIINISSVSGLFASPFLGAYAGSKFALEGLSDSLRRELSLLGIKVILIEPGPLKTNIWQKNLGLPENFPESIFSQYLCAADETILNIEKRAMPLDKLNPIIFHALEHKSPKNRYLVHRNPCMIKLITKLLPSKWIDLIITKRMNSNINRNK